MQRIPEAELMDDPAQALAYARADFSEPHNHFVELFAQRCEAPPGAAVLDLGCGPGDVCRRFARAFPDCRIYAVDASPAMLELGRDATRTERLHERIQFIQAYLPDAELPHPDYDVILSNSLLHHLAEPDALWNSIRRFGKPGTFVLVMDLLRPDSTAEAERLVERYADGEAEILREDFFNSLCAAYRLDEITAQLQAHGLLDRLAPQAVSDRHFIVTGHL